MKEKRYQKLQNGETFSKKLRGLSHKEKGEMKS